MSDKKDKPKLKLVSSNKVKKSSKPELTAKQLGFCKDIVGMGKDKDGNKIQVEYGFIPKLDDISFGEYIDLETYIGDWSQMEKAMAVLFRPVTNVTKDYYTIEEYEGSSKHATILKDMPLDVALSATVFFYRLGIKLQKYIMDSLASQTNKEATQGSKRTSEGSGDGINQYTHLHKEMLDGLKKSQRPLFISAL